MRPCRWLAGHSTEVGAYYLLYSLHILHFLSLYLRLPGVFLRVEALASRPYMNPSPPLGRRGCWDAATLWRTRNEYKDGSVVQVAAVLSPGPQAADTMVERFLVGPASLGEGWGHRCTGSLLTRFHFNHDRPSNIILSWTSSKFFFTNKLSFYFNYKRIQS